MSNESDHDKWDRSKTLLLESLYEPNLGPDDLFETISQALLNAVDRDTLSGWGAVVYIVTKDKVTKKVLKTRQD